MAKKLFFDKVDNPYFAVTTKGDVVLYNLKQISEDLYDEYTDKLNEEDRFTIFIGAGRFMCTISCSYSPLEAVMTAIDFNNNREEAEAASESFGDDKIIFMHQFNKIKYYEDYDNFEIVEGLP